MRLARTASVLFCIAVASTAGGFPERGSAASSPVESAVGERTWSSLGQTEPIRLAIPATVGMESENVWSFNMGDDASQGPDLWWYLRLTGTVEIDRSAESEGNTVLWVDVNGYASALLQYFVEGDGEIVWKSANYRGTLGGNESSSVIPFSFENVLPTPAVRPGNAKVRVFLETYENPGQVKVQVDPASSFVVSRSNPQELQLQYGAPKDENALIRVPMVLKNSGSSPALDVAIRV